MRKGGPVVVTALLALAAHAAFFVVSWPNIVATSQGHYDARQYRELAESVRAGGGFILETPHHGHGPDLSRTPGYPLFLALFGSGWDTAIPVVVVQHLMVLGIAFLIYWWMRRRGVSERMAIVGFALIAFDLTTMTYASYLLTETLFTLLLWTAVVLWPRAEDPHGTLSAMATGLFWGLATLTRPIAIYLLPGLVLLAATVGRRQPALLKRAAAAGLIGLLVVSVWYVRNYTLSGHIVFSTIEGENLLHYRAALVSLPDGVSLEDWRGVLRERSHEASYDTSVPREAAALDRERKRVAIDLIMQNPFYLYRPVAVGLPRLLIAPNRTYLYRLIGIEHEEWRLKKPGGLPSLSGLGVELPYILASSGYQLLLCLACVVGFIRAVRERNWNFVLPLLTLTYLVLLSSGLETHSRLRVPLVPGMAALAAYGLPSLVALPPRWRARP